mmetsp:Transcript_86886/g.246176  ORF Transcript_86886/g.246176 Transcript_86886/m.246176 type:complete len:202 (+) Transcript_86886:1583-2188(+)
MDLPFISEPKGSHPWFVLHSHVAPESSPSDSDSDDEPISSMVSETDPKLAPRFSIPSPVLGVSKDPNPADRGEADKRWPIPTPARRWPIISRSSRLMPLASISFCMTLALMCATGVSNFSSLPSVKASLMLLQPACAPLNSIPMAVANSMTVVDTMRIPTTFSPSPPFAFDCMSMPMTSTKYISSCAKVAIVLSSSSMKGT